MELIYKIFPKIVISEIVCILEVIYTNASKIGEILWGSSNLQNDLRFGNHFVISYKICPKLIVLERFCWPIQNSEFPLKNFLIESKQNLNPKNCILDLHLQNLIQKIRFIQ